MSMPSYVRWVRAQQLDAGSIKDELKEETEEKEEQEVPNEVWHI